MTPYSRQIDRAARTGLDHCSPTWLLAASEPPPPPVSFPPMFVMRSVQSIIGAVNVWTHAPALCSGTNLSLNNTWADLTSFPDTATHFWAVTTDSPGFTPPQGRHLSLLHPLSSTAPLPDDATFQAYADFHGTMAARASLFETQLLRLHCFFKSHCSGRSDIWQPPPTCSAPFVHTWV